MKKWFINVLALGFILLIGTLSAQETIAEGEGPGRRARLLDFNALGNANPLEQYLAIDNWIVNLNDSANYTYNRRLTYTKLAKSQSSDKNFIGVRINFPNYPNNAYATINPPLSFPFFGSGEFGVTTNVGNIKSIIARVAGRNFHHRVSLNIQHSDGEVIHAPLGNLEYLGWRDLQYDNPEYLESLKDRDLIIKPAYPRILPTVRFNDITFFRNGESPLSGDFVSYVAWVDIIYDYAFSESELDALRESEDYIDDDSIWKIISDELGQTESKLFQEKIERYRYLERIERNKMNLPPLNVPAPGSTTQQTPPAAQQTPPAPQ